MLVRTLFQFFKVRITNRLKCVATRITGVAIQALVVYTGMLCLSP